MTRYDVSRHPAWSQGFSRHRAIASCLRVEIIVELHETLGKQYGKNYEVMGEIDDIAPRFIRAQ